MSAATPPVPGRANLHVALALALGASPQESDKQLIARVARLRRLVEQPRELGLFAFLDQAS